MEKNKSSLKRILLSFITFVFVFSFVASTISSTPAFAAKTPANDDSTNPDDWNPITRAKRWAYLTGLYHCIRDANSAWDWEGGKLKRHLSDSNATSGDWFWNPTGPADRPNRPASYIDMNAKDNGKTDCNEIVKGVMNMYSLSGIQLVCALGASRTQDGASCEEDATKSDFNPPGDDNRMDLTKWWGTKDLPQSAGNTAYYQLNYYALMNNNGCKLKQSDASSDSKYVYNLNIVDESGKITKTRYIGAPRDWYKNIYVSYPGINDQNRSCAQMESDLNKFAKDYANWLLNHTTQTATNTDDSTGGGDDASSGGTSCAVQGIGWIVCPVMNFLANLNDVAFGAVNGFLAVPSSITSSDGLKKGWDIFRNIANVSFVIAFLIIIYSQLTGAGITNYGIKRLLPKLIIAAILVNASLIICQIAVDISNIVGSSIYDLLKGLGPSNGVSSGGGDLWAKAIGALLIVAVGIGLLIAVILAPTALIALGAAVVVLTARQAIIVLLIVVSPLAFVAYLLPNTESWFKRWWKMFSTMLLLYPVVGLVFGSSTLAAGILYGTGDKMMQLMALGVMAVPLFAVPTLLKGALAAAGSIGNQVAKLQGSANNMAKNSVKNSRVGEAKTAWDRRRQGIKAERRAGIGNGLRARANRAFDRTRLGMAVGGARGAAHATSEYDKTYDEDVKAAGTLLQARLSHMDILNAAASGQHDGRDLSEHERAAAIQYAMDRGNYNERRHIIAGRDMDGNEVGGGIGTMSRAQRKMAIGGMRAKGDTSIHGNGALAALEATDEHGTTGHTAAQVEGTLAGGTAEAINSGTLSVEAAAKDHRTAAYVAGVATGATTTAGDVAPNAGTGNRTAVTAPARANFHDAVHDFEATNPQSWTKLDGNTRGSLGSI